MPSLKYWDGSAWQTLTGGPPGGDDYGLVFGTGGNTSCVNATWTRLPIPLTPASASPASGQCFRINADGTVTVLVEGWYIVGALAILASIPTAGSGFQFGIFVNPGDTTPANPAAAIRAEVPSPTLSAGSPVWSASGPLYIAAGCRVGPTIYNRSGGTHNFGSDRFSIVRIGAGPGKAGVPPLVTSLPAAPANGDEIYLQTAQMKTDNATWRLRYDASVADAYKWVYLGGALVQSAVTTLETTAATAFADLATVGPQQAIDYAGLYDVSFDALLQTAAVSGNAAIATIVGPGVAAADGNALQVQTAAAAATLAHASRSVRATFTAGGAVKMQYRSSAGAPGTVGFQRRALRLTPVRIG